MLDSFSVMMNLESKSHSGFILPIPHNEPKSPTYINNFLFAYNSRKQNICFALAVSAASTTECCYHIVPPSPNQTQPKSEQLFHIPHFTVANWHTWAWLQHHRWDCVPSAGTALPQPRHIPGKAAATHFLNKSPLHPKSERTDSNFPKKVTQNAFISKMLTQYSFFYKGLVSLSTSCRSNLHQALQAHEWA